MIKVLERKFLSLVACCSRIHSNETIAEYINQLHPLPDGRSWYVRTDPAMLENTEARRPCGAAARKIHVILDQ